MRASLSALVVLAITACATADVSVMDNLRELRGYNHHDHKDDHCDDNYYVLPKTLSVCTKVHDYIGSVIADSDNAKLYPCDRSGLAPFNSTEVGIVQYICYPGSNPDSDNGTFPQTTPQQECVTTIHIQGHTVTYRSMYHVLFGTPSNSSFVEGSQTGMFKGIKFTKAEYSVENGASKLSAAHPDFSFYNVAERYTLTYIGKTYTLQ